MDPTAAGRAIQFAKDNLAPYATLSPAFKTDLERAMVLMIVPPENWSPTQAGQKSNFGQLADLVDPSLRKKVAKDVNEALLASVGHRREANIRHLVRTRAWAENMARERKVVDLPDQLSLGLDGEADTEMTGNGSTESAVRAESQ
jgi:glucose-induced degradation protein 8